MWPKPESLLTQEIFPGFTSSELIIVMYTAVCRDICHSFFFPVTGLGFVSDEWVLVFVLPQCSAWLLACGSCVFPKMSVSGFDSCTSPFLDFTVT